jgi:hypothetical protein
MKDLPANAEQIEKKIKFNNIELASTISIIYKKNVYLSLL